MPADTDVFICITVMYGTYYRPCMGLIWVLSDFNLQLNPFLL